MTTSEQPVFNERYELRNQIARGGTAQVYLARDLRLDRPVALKVLIPEFSSDHSFIDRFRREAQAAANLSHPNIVPVFDWGESDSTYFIVMEYVDGEALSSIIHTQGPLAPVQAASIAADIAKALAYSHRHGVVHRDVKPGNVLITSDGQVKVTDFGIARAIGGGDEQVTQTGLVMGTATYFSPEQAQGFEVDGRSDIYSLGVVLYEMATGKAPFTGETPVSIAYQHVREPAPTPRSINPEIPIALEAIILQAMAKLPAERYATADDFRADLTRFVQGQTVLAVPPTGSPVGPPTGVVPLTQAIPRTASYSGDGGDRSDTVKSTTPFWLAGAAVLLIVIGLIVFFGGRSLGYFGSGAFFRVPDVQGMTTSAARSELGGKGLRSSVQTVAGSTTTAKGTVVSQSPGATSTVKAGDTVHLKVAGAPPSVTVPVVTNLSLQDAEQQLKQSDFKWHTKFIPATSASQVQNSVIKQDPAGGTADPVGTFVTLDVVRGSKNVPVPHLIGESGPQAGADLSKAGLNLGTTTYAFSPTVAQGDVIDATPSPGTSVLQGTTVNITLSEGGGVVLPQLIGDSLAQAENQLDGLGLSPQQGAAVFASEAGLQGNVARVQCGNSPAICSAGKTLAPGTAVTLRLGAGAPTTSSSLPVGNTPGSTSTLPIAHFLGGRADR